MCKKSVYDSGLNPVVLPTIFETEVIWIVEKKSRTVVAAEGIPYKTMVEVEIENKSGGRAKEEAVTSSIFFYRMGHHLHHKRLHRDNHHDKEEERASVCARDPASTAAAEVLHDKKREAVETVVRA